MFLCYLTAKLQIKSELQASKTIYSITITVLQFF